MNKRKIIYELDYLKVKIEAIKSVFCVGEQENLRKELCVLINEIDSLIYKLEE